MKGGEATARFCHRCLSGCPLRQAVSSRPLVLLSPAGAAAAAPG